MRRNYFPSPAKVPKEKELIGTEFNSLNISGGRSSLIGSDVFATSLFFHFRVINAEGVMKKSVTMRSLDMSIHFRIIRSYSTSEYEFSEN